MASSLANLDSSDLQTIHGTVMNQLRPLLLSDVFDKELPRIGLTDYYQDPEGVLLLDNVQKDRYARRFWRFLIQTAADYSFESAGTEYFLLDDLDKLPRIGNLGELASRGRNASIASEPGFRPREASYSTPTVRTRRGRSGRTVRTRLRSIRAMTSEPSGQSMRWVKKRSARKAFLRTERSPQQRRPIGTRRRSPPARCSISIRVKCCSIRRRAGGSVSSQNRLCS